MKENQHRWTIMKLDERWLNEWKFCEWCFDTKKRLICNLIHLQPKSLEYMRLYMIVKFKRKKKKNNFDLNTIFIESSSTSHA